MVTCMCQVITVMDARVWTGPEVLRAARSSSAHLGCSQAFREESYLGEFNGSSCVCCVYAEIV